jgi:hypothetical protein
MKLSTRRLLSMACAAALLTTAACSDDNPSGPSDSPGTGGAVLLGQVVVRPDAGGAPGADPTGMRVSVVGSSQGPTFVDTDNNFVITGLPAGSVTLRFEGNGLDAQLPVSGLSESAIAKIEVDVNGNQVAAGSGVSMVPSADVHFEGTISSINDGRVVVEGRQLDVAGTTKITIGSNRGSISDLKTGDKVQVWGTLYPTGVITAFEIVR